ncbi:DNA-binding protein [Prevotella sp. P6B1]|uniref:HU family DNA-binding protein n=1 Tax=Prevotella sp. P6B1 TaxID=1410613 RepID=UPI00051AD2FE|nr:DNA-binding protein [Prevotella sp. P6B1]
MAIKVKAVERQLKVGQHAGKYRFMMQAEIYNTLSAQKVISEASVRSGIAEGALSAAWDAIGEVVKVWATEGHSIAIPGLGRMRFGVRATSVDDVNKVSTGLITTRRVIFSPSVEIKDELKETSINITCYDREGKVVKRVTSSDPGNIEDPEQDNDNTGSNTGDNTGGNTGGGNNGGGEPNPDGSTED